jgi:flagellar capping protein FliD
MAKTNVKTIPRASSSNTVERLSVVETKVENLDEKIDELKIDVKQMHDCLDRTRDELKHQFLEMQSKSIQPSIMEIKSIFSKSQKPTIPVSTIRISIPFNDSVWLTSLI